MGAALLIGWAMLACAGAGIDLADGLGGRGPASLAFGLAVAAPLAAWTLVMARGAAVYRAPATLLALGAGGALVAWSAASIAWAAAPDLAWLDTNRMALAFAALVIGAGLGALISGAARHLAVGLSLAAVAPVGWALATKLLPATIAGESAAGRLQEPVTYSNALGLITAIAVPGALLAAMEGRPRSWRAPLAAAWVALLLVACLATLSRGSLALLFLAAAITLAGDPRRLRGAATAIVGVVGAILPGVFVVTSDALTGDGAGEAARTAAGADLAWRLAVGVAIALVLSAAYERAEGRLGVRHTVASALLVTVVAAGVFAASPQRASGDLSLPAHRDPGPAAITQDPGRLSSWSLNNRARWWREASAGWRASPIIGHGAGGFRLVQLQERDGPPRDDLRTVEPHQALLRTLSGTGLIGALLLVATIAGLGWGTALAARRSAWPEVGAPIAILAAIVLQSMVDWTIAIPALTVAGAGVAGTLLARAAPGPVTAGRRPAASAALVPAAVVVAALAVASGVLPWGSQRAVAASQNALAAGDVDTALDRADLARQLDPLSPRPLWARAEALSATGEPARALGAYIQATELQPDNPATWRRLGLAAGDGELGARAWREALRLDPQDEQSQARAALGSPPVETE